MEEPSAGAIYQTAVGFMAAKHLFAASELGIFEAVADTALSLKDLARRLRVPQRTARISADAMVALGFLEKNDGTYRNTPVAAAFLSGRGPHDLTPFLRFWNQISYPTWAHLEDSLRTGKPALGTLTPEQGKVFSEGVAAFTSRAAAALPSAYDFGPHHRLLDLGGGTGSFLVPILASHQHLEATLFELPRVADIARKKLKLERVGERVSVRSGDILRAEIPKGHDVVLLANVVHVFLPEQNLRLFRRVRARVAKGARLLLVDLWTDTTHTRPLPVALEAGEFLVMVGGDVYSEEEVSAWLADTGWKALKTVPLDEPEVLTVAEAV